MDVQLVAELRKSIEECVGKFWRGLQV